MGKGLADASPHARAVFQEVDDALGEHLSRLMWEGPEDELTLTANAQPAIMAVGIAALRVLEHEAGVRLADTAAFVAGHSLGEYTALCAAGSLGLADTARLLRLRGTAMQAAVPPGVGANGGAAGAGFRNGGRNCRRSGPRPGVRSGERQCHGPGGGIGPCRGRRPRHEPRQGQGARHSVLLPVSAPFHCALMQPAADAMAQALSLAPLAAPTVPLVANVTAAPVTDPDAIRGLLVDQVCGTVRWRESVLAMAELGVTGFVELGGKVLGPMIRRITPDVPTITAADMAGVEAIAAAIA